MSEPTNKDRAGWAFDAVVSFAQIVGQQDEDLETNMSDLLANLRHLCDRKGLKWSEVDNRGHMHYSAEVVEERQMKADRKKTAPKAGKS